MNAHPRGLFACGCRPQTQGDSFRAFFDAVGSFFDSIGAVQWGPLTFAICFTLYLTLRSRASFNILRAAYPEEQFRWREVWAAYFAGYGFNSVIPARGGDIIRLFLTRTAVPHSTYPAIAATFAVEMIYDIVFGEADARVRVHAGHIPEAARLLEDPRVRPAFFAGHPRFTLFVITALGIATLVAMGVLSVRVKAFWGRVRQGLTILYDRRRYVREVSRCSSPGGCSASRPSGCSSRRSTSAGR